MDAAHRCNPGDADDDAVNPTTPDAAEVELPTSQPSDPEHAAIHDQLTLPVESAARPALNINDADDVDSFSGSVSSEESGRGSGSDSGESGDDEKSVHLSNYANDDAISFVESCSSVSCFTDSSDDEESDGDVIDQGRRKRKRSSSGSVGRRRQSNSDTDEDEDDDDSDVENASKEEGDGDAACDQERKGEGSETNNFDNDGDDKPASPNKKVSSIWDLDADHRSRQSDPKRKLWSDYTYTPESSSRRPRPGSRFTSSFSEKSLGKGLAGEPNRNNGFGPQVGIGLGRGSVRENASRREPNARPSGPANSWQQRRPNNPYCHYQQQQQRYFGMPRGSYASVVQKGPRSGGPHQNDSPSRNNNTNQYPGSNQYDNARPNSQQSYQRQSNNNQQQPQPNKPTGRDRQSYNRGTVTAAQILQQQRLQQSLRQQARSHEPQKQAVNDLSKGREWQPPRGAFAMMIGNQPVYVINPTGNRPPIAREDPAVVRADPPIPQPYIVLPGGIPLSLTPGMQGDPRGNGGFPNAAAGGNGRCEMRHVTEEVLRKICRCVRRPTRQYTRLPAFNALPNIPPSQRMPSAHS